MVKLTANNGKVTASEKINGKNIYIYIYIIRLAVKLRLITATASNATLCRCPYYAVSNN